MKTEQIVEALEAAVRQLGVEVRRERGSFRGGYCTIDGRPVVVLNKRRPVEAHLAALAQALRELPVDEVYLRPAVRDALEDLWAQEATSGGADVADALDVGEPED
ncbi:MAG: hypothetical protein R3362_07540 [Rhodothermales bacterium]|nr:hypothetical protein [Rhodothermales bacterium]